nr:hypothetical protein GCM10020063_023230 [Dactylosporangium thailandense]
MASLLVKQGAPTVDKAHADTAWAEATVASATRLAQLGAKPIIMRDTPDPRGISVPDCVAAHPAAVQQCALKVPTAIYATRKTAIEAAAQPAGITVLDPTEWFRDGSHVTTTYIKLLTPLPTAALTS